MKTYIALTIGPIYKTLVNAKKTQELWASSYMFSYLMKEIIRKVYKNNTFIVPYVDEEVMEETKAIGLFHDRFIYEQTDEKDLEILGGHIDDCVEDLAQKLGIHYDYLRQYLQIHYDTYEVKVNPILEISPYLDTLELQYQVAPEGENLLQEALKKDDSFLKEMHFKSRPFPSLPEIALADQLIKANEPLASSMRNYLHKEPTPEVSLYENEIYNKNLKSYHKYVAIIHADGDNMSKVIAELKDNDFSKFSSKLFEYCSLSAELIKAYGGETIFAGGDDLLFFAPIYNMTAKQNNIFGLIDDISKVFDNAFTHYNAILKEKGVKEQATLSFGVRIVYYKYPLYEALEESRNLLFDVAKEIGSKNNIAFTFSKHAGQTFGTVVHKGDSFYEHFSSLMERMSKIENASNFLGSLHHKIDTHKVLIREACGHPDETRIKNFFENFFKQEHKHEVYKPFFEQMIAYIYKVYQLDINDEQKLKLIYAPLKYIKHIQGDKS